jgi:hypothetical protein
VTTILDNHDILRDFIVECSNTKDARRILYREHFDLMILDLVLPSEDMGECDSKHGLSFLNEIGINPNINPPIHILGLSGFKEQVSAHSEDFQKKLWNLIDYEETSSEWEDQLKSIIFHLVKTRQQFINDSFINQSDLVIGYLEHNKIPNTILGLTWKEISNNVANIIEASLEVPKMFKNGSRAQKINSTNIRIQSEYDFQNLIHLVLRSWIPSVEPENITVIFDGNEKRADFSIKGNSLIIEAKYIDSTGKKNDVLKTLSGLKTFYTYNANVKSLLFLILVEDSVDFDKYKIQEEFSQMSTVPSICIRTMFNKLK